MSTLHHHAWRLTLALLAAMSLVIALGPVGQAAAKPTPKELRKQLARQQKQLDSVIVQYNARLEALTAAKKTESQARTRWQRAQKTFEEARRGIQQMVTLRYQGAGADMAMFSADPSVTLGQAALLQELSDERTARLLGFTKIRDELSASKDAAARRTRELGEAAARLRVQRRKAEGLIEEIKDKLDRLATPTSRRTNGTWSTELPAGPDNITPRMQVVRDLIRQRFSLAFGIGCYRSANDGGEHYLGRACDFMVSSGGAMPSSTQAALGDQISAWAIENASRLGIMYIIYRQRIWHIRTGAWKPMSDRGGVTANHYDHPHISVY